MASNEVKEMHEKLLKSVKKEVKQIMEESVTKKFVHEESGSITSLCSAVEVCMQHGLKKRALGLFKHSTTTALIQKVSKNFEPAAQIVKLMHEIETNNENSKKSIDSNRNTSFKKNTYNPKYLWIRLALFEKQLAKIIDFLVQHSSKYYEKDALLSDPVDGEILASLLVGPCALDYTKMKTSDHYWTDPPADELMQRHRIHSSTPHHHIRADSPKRPGLQVRRHTSSSSEESMRVVPLSAKEYVESLHQNNKSTLLYGKNNVLVQPKEDVTPLAGYLSLHQGPEGLSVKWTPNQLMNGCSEEEDATYDRRPVFQKYRPRHHSVNGCRKFLYWDYAVTIFMDEIVYLHCHQQPDSGGTIVMVGQDGVQRPPIHFPKGGHLLAFLSCMENGLLPHGQLDPPLWSQRGKGKVFPKMKRKGSRMTPTLISTQDSSLGSLDETTLPGLDEEEATDYVFRLITSFKPENMPAELLDPKAEKVLTNGSGPETGSASSGSSSSFSWPSFWDKTPGNKLHVVHALQSPAVHVKPVTVVEMAPSAIQTYAQAQQNFNVSCFAADQVSHVGQASQTSHIGQAGTAGPAHRTAVKQLCDTMTRQILSRAFYGWLSYCRHLKTVRTHLSGMVNSMVISVEDPTDASEGLTVERWRKMCQGGKIEEATEVYRLVYYGGCAQDIRREVWPYLLGHYKFDAMPDERKQRDESVKTQYEQTMSEWLAVEAIVRQRDKEIMAANLAKLSNESQDGHIPLMRKDSSLSNDVFESVDSDDFSHPETVPEESSSALLTPTTPTPVPEQLCQSKPTSTSSELVLESEPHLITTIKSAETKETTSPDEGLGDSIARGSSLSESKRSDSCDTGQDIEVLRSESDDNTEQKNILITTASVAEGLEEDIDEAITEGDPELDEGMSSGGEGIKKILSTLEDGEHLSASRESLLSPASPVSNASNGGIYSAEMLDNVALNIHRIDKDVQRCDRNYWYFNLPNLDKLRNIMCTYVWEHLEVGYVQGMCDLVAPLLVIFDDEAKTYSCFCQLMKRMSANFPHGGAMDQHFANMRSLIQILDPELFEHMHQNGDYTHFYFCYRWFLLDFKRELKYEDVFSVWETIWAARHISSPQFVLFIALALVEYYREIIMDNNMDFTDIIKFFNEMAERHSSKQVLKISRDLVYKLQDLIENK